MFMVAVGIANHMIVFLYDQVTFSRRNTLRLSSIEPYALQIGGIVGHVRLTAGFHIKLASGRIRIMSNDQELTDTRNTSANADRNMPKVVVVLLHEQILSQFDRWCDEYWKQLKRRNGRRDRSQHLKRLASWMMERLGSKS